MSRVSWVPPVLTARIPFILEPNKVPDISPISRLTRRTVRECLKIGAANVTVTARVGLFYGSN